MTHLIHLTIPKVADAGAPRRIRTAQLTTRETSTSAAMVSADGDIDAANANAFIDYTLANAASSSGLIVDLRHVQFIAVEGFSAAQDRGSLRRRRHQLGVSTWTLS